MTRLLLLFSVLTLASCNGVDQKSEQNFELVKQYDYRLIIEEWNGFAGYQSTFILNNLRIAMFDSSEKDVYKIKPLTLYHISHSQITDPQNENRRIFISKDTTETPFSKEQSETLFNLTRKFLKSVDFNNYDTAINSTITRPVIMDDSHARIELNYGGRTLSATISSISNPTFATPELEVLLHFINRFNPKNEE
jgi:hypothetical protein